MAKHKSATEVTLQTEEKSSFELWVYRNWPKAAVLGVIIAAGIIFVKTRSDAAEASRGIEWNELALPTEGLGEFQAASQKLAGTPIEGWARLLETQKAISEDNLEAAASAAQALGSLDGHLLNRMSFPIGKDGASVTLGDQLAKNIAAQNSWEQEHSSILSNPEPPADAPKVTIKTEEGDIVVALYSDIAPEHSANFIKVAQADQYDGTKFHRIMNNGSMKMIQGGDPNSLEDDVTKWGQGGPGYSLEQEKNGLVHDSGYLSMAKPPGDPKSSGSQFFLTFGRIHYLDGQHTVFGKVLSGMDVIKKIGTADVRPYDQETRIGDMPEAPITITDVIVNQ